MILNSHFIGQSLDWVHFCFATVAIGKEIQAEMIANGRPSPAKIRNAMSNPYTWNALKKIGLVFIGLAKPSGVKSFDFQLGKNRQQIIEKSANKALEILYKEITSYNI